MYNRKEITPFVVFCLLQIHGSTVHTQTVDFFMVIISGNPIFFAQGYGQLWACDLWLQVFNKYIVLAPD